MITIDSIFTFWNYKNFYLLLLHLLTMYYALIVCSKSKGNNE